MVGVVVISCLFSQSFTEAGNASIQPVITTTMPKKMTIGLQEVTLHWYIIDDNLDNYAIYINNSIWKKNSITSNLLEVQFSNSVGSYNITLSVTDFSNYSASYQMIIIVSQSSQTTTIYAITTQSTSGATPGFGFLEALSLLCFLVVTAKLVKFSKKKSR